MKKIILVCLLLIGFMITEVRENVELDNIYFGEIKLLVVIFKLI